MPPSVLNVLVLVAGLISISLIVLILISRLLLGQDETTDRIQAYATRPLDEVSSKSRTSSGINRFRVQLNRSFHVFITENLTIQLVSANWSITEVEYVLLRFGSVIFAFFLGSWVSGNILPGIGLGFIAFILPGFLLQLSVSKRRKQFSDQLLDVLVLINGAVKTGYSFLQSLDLIIEEMPPPASQEFARVRREVALGLSLTQAFTNLSTRMENQDLDLVITAIKINLQSGGNLSTIIQSVTDTIRERIQLFSEVRAITSQQRMASSVLTLLPFIVTAVLFILNPDYISNLFNPGPFLCIPIGAIILVLIGNLLIRRLTVIEF